MYLKDKKDETKIMIFKLTSLSLMNFISSSPKNAIWHICKNKHNFCFNYFVLPNGDNYYMYVYKHIHNI